MKRLFIEALMFLLGVAVLAFFFLFLCAVLNAEIC